MQEPGQAKLGGRAAGPLRKGLEAGEKLEVPGEGLALEPRHPHPEITGVQAAEIAHAPGEKAPANGAEGDEGHAKLAAGVTNGAEGDEGHAKLAAGVEDGDLGVPGPGGVFGLERGDGVDGAGPAKGLRRDLGKADRPDLPLCD